MDQRPKPHPPKPTPSPVVEEPTVKSSSPEPNKPSPKKPYVVRPHLTDKPLAGNEQLAALRKSMQNPISTKRPAVKRAPKKSQEKK